MAAEHRPRVAPEVAEAVAHGLPVVALESTLFAHGLPHPENLAVARELEDLLRGRGVVPATVGVVAGEAVVGLSGDDVELLATTEVAKASTRDLPFAAALGAHAATTVAATSFLAWRAGIRLFSTGGLGGVHRDAQRTFDESADLAALARVPVTVVCAGVKSVLDVPATLERLETLGVGVAGYGTGRFPGFLVADSGHPVPWRLDGPAQVVAAIEARDALGLRTALVVANPVPDDEQLDPARHDELLADALAAASETSVAGKDVTPFLLDHMRRASAGASLTANVAAVRHNVAVAADLALELSRR